MQTLNMEGLMATLESYFAYASTSSSYGRELYNFIKNYIKKYSKYYDDDEDDDNDYFNSFPPGYRFNPTEEELVVSYLMKKVRNEPLPRNQMLEVDVYQHDPEIVCNKYKNTGENEWYFFSPRERKYPNGVRPKRTTRDGYWKVSGSEKLVFSKGRAIGKWNTLVYYRGKAPTGTKTNWIMREFKLAQQSHRRTSNMDMMLDDFVLCKIYKKTEANKNSKSKSKGIKEEEAEEGFATTSDIIKAPQYLRNGYDQSYSNIIYPNPSNYKYDSSCSFNWTRQRSNPTQLDNHIKEYNSSCLESHRYNHHLDQYQYQDFHLSDHNTFPSYVEDKTQTFSEIDGFQDLFMMLEGFDNNNNNNIGPYSLKELSHDLNMAVTTMGSKSRSNNGEAIICNNV